MIVIVSGIIIINIEPVGTLEYIEARSNTRRCRSCSYTCSCSIRGSSKTSGTGSSGVCCSCNSGVLVVVSVVLVVSVMVVVDRVMVVAF